MTITTHTAIGATIGTFIGGPFLGFFLGVISHFLVDMIPHGDRFLDKVYYEDKRKKPILAYFTIDAIVAILLLLVFININPKSTVFAFSCAVFGSVLPDLLIAIRSVISNRFLEGFNRLHTFFHNCIVDRIGDVKLRHSIIVQGVFVVLLISWIS